LVVDKKLNATLLHALQVTCVKKQAKTQLFCGFAEQ
jgi:hypothetical protein